MGVQIIKGAWEAQANLGHWGPGQTYLASECRQRFGMSSRRLYCAPECIEKESTVPSYKGADIALSST